MSSRVLFIGSKHLGLATLRLLVSAAADRVAGVVTFDDGRDTRSALADIRTLAESAALPLLISEKATDLAAFAASLAPDLALVVGWYRVLPATLLKSFPRGAYGVHFSPLPRYRGGSPLVWQIINGERQLGISLFRFTAGMDDGPLLLQDSVPIGPDDHVGDVLARAERRTLELLDGNLAAFLENRLEAREQNHDQATFCVMRRPEDGQIDWRQPARRVYDFIRAQSTPYPGAFSYLDQCKVTLWRARPLPALVFGQPGQVTGFFADGPAVVCGDNSALLVTCIQVGEEVDVPPGKVLRPGIRLRWHEPSLVSPASLPPGPP